MRILRHPTDTPDELKRGVAALGNFDGVHLGHRYLIGRARAIATGRGMPLSVVTFEPHPREFFLGDQPNFRLTPLRAKARQLETLGVDLLAALHFDRGFSEQSPETFVRTVLVEGLDVRHVVVGYDFVFGHKRAGTTQVLTELGHRFGFGVTIVEAAGLDGEIYSSTRVRNLLGEGRPDRAAAVLGHWWEVSGRVGHGDARGRTIGFPTANLSLDGFLQPALGVYAVRVAIEEEGARAPLNWHDGVANLGRRPTVDGEDVRLEAHLFDFDGDLYDRHLRVAFVARLRPEQKFSGLEELTGQIARDCLAAREILADPAYAANRFDNAEADAVNR
ncbi:bifunctional riboflavin kinase/FAD synthetase [Oceanibacterium hippocampi]|uniref:Riboflavin biosynthesis protein n=1 Tax=Oceanibacterium hippocampi TaxID=745714 RepID=A0A1Y5S952_9PROT|nr:bifunctional riboflavin kinase/FAD synthetase [Oceanibacterium hippocampi]SLN32848.1 Riboflavin biosynthesis protein RibF [Oceanibacterium hippocampi]